VAGQILAVWIVFFLIWLAATVSLEPARVATGLCVAAATAYFAATRTKFWSGLGFGPRRLLAVVAYLVTFLIEMIKSNLAVLAYVYSPTRKVASDVIRVPVRLKGARERLTLANTVALTPGTLPIDLTGDTLEVHVLDKNLVDGAVESVGDFETLLENSVG
jgi:multicomponent Na+:H+ antiporter subunit E